MAITIAVSVLQVSQARLREVGELIQHHTAKEPQRGIQSAGILTQGLILRPVEQRADWSPE